MWMLCVYVLLMLDQLRQPQLLKVHTKTSEPVDRFFVGQMGKIACMPPPLARWFDQPHYKKHSCVVWKKPEVQLTIMLGIRVGYDLQLSEGREFSGGVVCRHGRFKAPTPETSKTTGNACF